MNENYETLIVENILLDWKFYFVNSSELNEKNIFKKSGVIEYLKKNHETIYNIIIGKKKEDVFKLLNVKQRNHMLFRYMCCNYLNLIRILKLPDVSNNSKYEAVLIECRCFPHTEFLIRNTIYKLGEQWSHTVICGTQNYSYMSNMISKISPNYAYFTFENGTS